MYIINQGSVTCIQWFAVIALSFQCLSFQDWRQCIAIHVYECDREMDKDSENDGLFCMKKNTLFIHGCLIRHIYNN